MDRKALCVLLLMLLVAKSVFASTPVPASVTALATQAAKGNAKAQVALGELYQSGTGVEQSLEKAADLYTQAAERGNSQGEFDLANLYYLGLGLPQDSAKAVEWFEKAGRQGNTDADETLATMYQTGKGVPQDLTQAAAWYRRAAELGDTLAQVHLGTFYQNATGVKKDYKQALVWYRRAAARGNVVAETSLGWTYINGLGVKKDIAAAQSWYLKAAGQDSPEAELALGDFYLEGRFGKPDFAQALKWLTQSAGHEDSDAQFLLGEMYRLGYGVTRNDATAFSWYQKASDNGDPPAEMQLSAAYYHGIAVPMDKPKALSLMRAAADGGYAPAQMAMSAIYFAGRDVPRDAAQGKVWLDRAVAQNYPHAVCEAASATLNGMSSDADRAQALVTMQAQAKAGDAPCINDVAWYLATTPGVKPEDLAQSAEMMGKIVAVYPKDPAYLDTMAAVEAAEAHYAAAATDEQQAIDAASAFPGTEDFLKVANARLALYRSNKPYITPPVASTIPAPQPSTTKSSVLGPGEGYAAIQLDLNDPNPELLFASSDTNHIQIDDAPVGRSLYLFPVSAGHYCMSMYYYTGQKIYPKGLGCFDVAAGKLAFSGYLTPAVLYGNIAVGQIRDDAAGQAALRSLYPEIAEHYFGPAPQADPLAPASVVQSSPVGGCYANEPTEVVLTGTLTDGLYRAPIKNNSVNSNKLGRAYDLTFASHICTWGNLQRGGVDRPYSDIPALMLVYGSGSSALYGAIGQYKGKKIRCTGEIFDRELRLAKTTDCQPVPEQSDGAAN
jgi:uncharacterized protein